MTSFETYFDNPNNYPSNTHYDRGGNPFLLTRLTKYLKDNRKDLKEITLCLYLYNNYYLDDLLNSIAKSGVSVTVITIPLDGFDSINNNEITQTTTGKKNPERKSKFQAAKYIFDKHKEKKVSENFSLLFMPHIYVRSAKLKKFSRGALPYSFHVKFCLIELKNKSSTIILSSCNFSFGDLSKFENLLFIKNDEESYNHSLIFKKQVMKSCLNISQIDFDKIYNEYKIDAINYTPIKSIGFTGPFFSNSNIQVEDVFINILKSAKNRVYIAAQHLSALDYYLSRGNKRRGFLGELLDLPNNIKVNCLSMTYHKKYFKGHKMRTPENTRSFEEFVDALKKRSGSKLYINSHFHSKYIIVDNLVIVTTFNYTPTQFIYKPKVNIKSFDNMPKASYNGIFSEIGAFVVIDNLEIVNQYITNFKEIVADSGTISIL